MKGRPRRIEREVAFELSSFFSVLGLDKVKRVPILGRTGPDIETNSFQLVVDVKSRQSVPKTPLPDKNEIVICSDKWAGVRLGQLPLLADVNHFYIETEANVRQVKNSVVIQRWLDHMDEWTQANMPNGISGLVLHKSGGRMWVKHSLALIKLTHTGAFHDRYSYYQSRNK